MTEDEARALDAQRCEALLRADVATLDRLFADDLVWIHSSGRADGKAAFVRAVSDGTARYLQIDRLDDGSVRVEAGVAIVCAVFDMVVSSNGTPRLARNRTTTLWAERDGGVQMIWGQSTSMTPQSTACSATHGGRPAAGAQPEAVKNEQSPGDKVTS